MGPVGVLEDLLFFWGGKNEMLLSHIMYIFQIIYMCMLEVYKGLYMAFYVGVDCLTS